MCNIMVSWIGNNDLKSIDKNKLTGPVYALLNSKHGKGLDEVYLLCNYEEKDSNKYFEMLSQKHKIEYKYTNKTLAKSPMNYELIYEEVENYLKYILDLQKDKKVNWHFHTSPGTQAMSSVWVLLGKTKYNAKLYYSWLDKDIQRVEEAKIPFDISIDYLPELYKQREQKVIENWDIIPAFKEVIHSSKKMKEVLNRASVVAKYNVPVLLLGETGTGKELFAKGIHKNSDRKDKAFEAVNCGAIPADLIETMLFGWSKGAFTSSVGDSKGLFLKCNGGTLFLDEVGELSLNLQVKLLRVLQEKKIMRVGDNKTFDVDVRIITATNRNLAEMVVENKFREDLFHRIAIGVIEIPSLKARGGSDIVKIAEYFLEETNDSFSEPVSIKNMNIQNPYIKKVFSISAMNEIKKYNWPGNVRELHNSIIRACLWNQTDTINAEDIKKAIIQFIKKKTDNIEISDEGVDLKKILFDIEKKHIEVALSKTKSKKEAASLLGINHKTFEKRCRTSFNL